MFANFATALPAGATMTFLILFGMQSLIAMQPGVTAEPRTPPEIFIYKKPPEPLIVDPPKPIDRPDVQELPPTIIESILAPEGTGTPVRFNPTPPGPGKNIPTNPFTSDGPLMVIVRVEPQYPPIAASRGLEGFVVVRFDVLPDGTAHNITVVQSSSSVFERAAIKAASRFRFKARVVDGVPLASSGVQYQFRFEMDK